MITPAPMHNNRPTPQAGDQCEYEGYNCTVSGDIECEWKPLGIMLSVGQKKKFARYRYIDGTIGRIAYSRIRKMQGE